MKTPLEQYPEVRNGIYTGMWVIGGLTTLANVGYAAAGGLPQWLTVLDAVVTAAGTYVGYQASANTVVEDFDPDNGDADADAD